MHNKNKSTSILSLVSVKQPINLQKVERALNYIHFGFLWSKQANLQMTSDKIYHIYKRKFCTKK